MMKKFCVIMLMLVFMYVPCLAATEYYWTNNYGAGDHDFKVGTNWLDKYDDIWATDDIFQVDYGGSTDYASISADVTASTLRIGKIASGNGEVRVVGGNSSFSASLLIGGNGSSDTDAYGKLIVSDGNIAFGTYATIGQYAIGDVEINGGKFTANRMNLGVRSTGVANVAISNGLCEIATYINVGTTNGENGKGTITVSGGKLTAANINLAYRTTSIGNLFITDGEVDLSSYLAVGVAGDANFTVSDGVFHADRANFAQLVDTNAKVVLSGGEMIYDNSVEVGRAGTALLEINGSTGVFECGSLSENYLSTINLVLNGAAGVGSGITVKDGAAALDGLVNPSFSGTAFGGNYIVMTAVEGITDVCNPGVLLTDAATSAGWSYDIINAGRGQALLLNYPISGSTATWTNSAGTQLWSNSGNWSGTVSSDGKAVIDLAGTDGAILDSSTTVNTVVVGNTASGALTVNSGAVANFGNLTLADANTSSSVMAITGGTVNVGTAIVGYAGDADLTITAGQLTADNLVAGANDESSADISISGTAGMEVEGFFGIGSTGEMTISGYQADILVGNMSTAAGSVINMEFNGALGVGNGIIATGDVDLAGTIAISFNGSRVEGTYTVIKTEGKIVDSTNGELLSALYCTYAIVQNGDYQELQITVGHPENCQQLIDSGSRLAADLNSDCKVNMADVAEFALQWLWCNDPANPECNWQLTN